MRRSIEEQTASSVTERDEVLREGVRVLRQDRHFYNWVGIYLLEGNTLVLHNYIGKSPERIFP